ncbi:hypothetical protein [Azospirillum brasilense]|nr:hypothetical protein [Azospirillum brasilense]
MDDFVERVDGVRLGRDAELRRRLRRGLGRAVEAQVEAVAR